MFNFMPRRPKCSLKKGICYIQFATAILSYLNTNTNSVVKDSIKNVLHLRVKKKIDKLQTWGFA